MTRTAPEQVAGPYQALAIDLDPVPPTGHELGLDQDEPPIVVAHVGAHDRRVRADAHQRFGRRGSEAGQGPEIGHRLREVRLALTVVADDDRRAGREREDSVAVVAEVDQLEPLDDHDRLAVLRFRAPGPASAGTGSRPCRRPG